MLEAKQQIMEMEELLSTDTLIKFEPSEELYPRTYRNVISIAKEIEFSQDHPSFNSYRQRRFPAYFLSLDRTDYPIYYSRDDVSMAILVRNYETESLADQIATHVNITVQLEKYAEQFEKNNKSSSTKRKAKQILSEYSLETQIALISSANDAIKHIIGEVYFKYKIELKKLHAENYFALKVNLVNPSIPKKTNISMETFL